MHNEAVCPPDVGSFPFKRVDYYRVSCPMSCNTPPDTELKKIFFFYVQSTTIFKR